ncbi:glycerophosphodiester phosphodiesterase family protein [Psychroserpens sp. AS72]|uniref:glycerophosphodiester phosphodiesterase n=1 Tax=Psychroserpens sp. AS72 TaxID=3135775 RepID=UPI00317C09A3
MSKPLKIGHRGAKAHVPENTIASIEKALQLGVDGIEIDVHKCASGEIVVFHDFNLDRLTNSHGEISNYTLLELKNLKVAKQFEIPTLVEVLDYINGKCLLNIELKGKDTALETSKIITQYLNSPNWYINQFLISSFDFQELESFYTINKNVRLGVLTESNIEEALTFAQTINAYSIHPDYNLLNADSVKLIQDSGYKVFTWTVNGIEAIKRMADYNVDAIISDNPERL